MNKTYKIGDLAKIFGVSVQTIRFYEEKGLLKPVIKENSGYRYYDNWNVNNLLDIVQLKKQSFSLNQAKEVMKAENLEEIAGIYNKQIIETIKKIDQLEKVRDALVQQKRIIQDFDKYLDDFQIVHSPQLLFHKYRTRNSLLSLEFDKETQKWIDMIPEASPTFYLDSINLDEDLKYFWGYSLPIKKGVQKNLDFETNYYIPSQTSIHMTFIAGNENTFTKSLLNNVLNPIKDAGFQIVGKPYGKLIIRTLKSQEIKRYFEIWVPIDDSVKQ